MNGFHDNVKNCEHLNPDELVYHSSEQYLILCLKICNLIIKYNCTVKNLIDFNRYTTVKPSSKPTETQIYEPYNTSLKNITRINTNSNTIEAHTTKLFESSTELLNIYSTLSSSSNVLFSGNSFSPILLSNLNETECAKYGHRESYKLSLFILGIILCVIIMCLNSFTLITILKSKRLINSITHILIVNLSLSDFLLGVAFLYPCTLNLLTINALETYNPYLYTLACNIRNYYYLCLAGYSPMITSMLSSMFTLLLLALEKYMAIIQPYIYKRLIQDRKYLCFLCILITWIISIVVSLLPIMGWNEANIKSATFPSSIYKGFDCKNAKSLPCMFERIFTLDYILLFTSICCACALTMLTIYVKIYFIARKHYKQIEKISNSFLNMTPKSVSQIKTQRTLIETIESNKRKSTNEDLDFSKEESQTTFRKSAVLNNNQQNEMVNTFSFNEINMWDSLKTTRNTVSYNKNLDKQSQINTNIDLRIKNGKIAKRKNSLINSNIFVKNNQSLVFLSTPIETNLNTISKQTIETPNKNNFFNKRLNSLNIFFLNKNHQVKLNKMRKCRSASNLERICNLETCNNSSSTTTKHINSSMKAMKTLLILLLGFYVCWLPLIVYFLTFATQKYNNLVIYILMFVACCNAVIDPLVYAFCNREFNKY